jgi:hypothetical protein
LLLGLRGSIALSWRQYDLFEQMNAGALLQAPMVAALRAKAPRGYGRWLCWLLLE